MHFASTHPPNPVLKLKAHEFEDVPPMAEDHVPDKKSGCTIVGLSVITDSLVSWQ